MSAKFKCGCLINKMSLTTKTGLTAAPKRSIERAEQPKKLKLKPVAHRVPLVLKRYTSFYNPYPYGCSFLCNHPTDKEAKELLKKAKDSWANNRRNLLLPEEIDAIRQSLKQICHITVEETDTIPQVESVPEELFRRYTDTDSRPLTPAPTLASAATRASDSRKCITPEPFTNTIREKTLLVLDLRRSHSQETISWHGSTCPFEPPLIHIQRVPTRVASPEDLPLTEPSSSRSPRAKLILPVEKPRPPTPKLLKKSPKEEKQETEECIRRRGRKRRKGRDISSGPLPAQTDPETQITIDPGESRQASANPKVPETPEKTHLASRIEEIQMNSFLGIEILKHFRRELNDCEDVIDNEFNNKRKIALQETLRTMTNNKIDSQQLINLEKELNVVPIDTDFWLSLPRIFSKQNAKFELPLDSRTLATMTPLEYLRHNVRISKPQKLLYNCIFNKFRLENERKLPKNKIQHALNLVMGKEVTEPQATNFKNLTRWEREESLDFQTFCGLSALSERLSDLQNDFCHEIEIVDFRALSRKVNGKNVDKNLLEILEKIKESQ